MVKKQYLTAQNRLESHYLWIFPNFLHISKFIEDNFLSAAARIASYYHFLLLHKSRDHKANATKLRKAGFYRNAEPIISQQFKN